MYIKVEKPFSLKLYVKYLPGIFHYPSPKYLMQYSVPKSPEIIATIASVSGDKKKKAQAIIQKKEGKPAFPRHPVLMRHLSRIREIAFKNLLKCSKD